MAMIQTLRDRWSSISGPSRISFNQSEKTTSQTYDPRFPGFDKNDYDTLESMVKDINNPNEKEQVMNELYRTYYTEVQNQHKLRERNQVLNDKIYQDGQITDKKLARQANSTNRATGLSQNLKTFFNNNGTYIDAGVDDVEFLQSVAQQTSEIYGVDGYKLIDRYVNEGDNEILYLLGAAERPKEENLLQKAGDIAVGIAQSPGKRGYNMVGQWMDKLGKAVADKLEGTDLQKWVQEKAIEAFGEDEVKSYQEERARQIAEGTAFNGREATDIRTPLLGEERANSGWTKAGETVGDIATGIAMSAPLASAVAPAIAGGTLGQAAAIGGAEGLADTLLTQYGSQGNLDVTPSQLALGVGGGAIGGIIANKLANLPKKTVNQLKKNAQKQLKSDVTPYIERSIKPTVKGKLNQTQYDKFIDDTMNSVSDMVNNKNLLKYTDETGEIVKGELPKNMRETAEAIGNYKVNVYKQYNNIAKRAGDAGARVNLNKVYEQLDDLERDVSQNIANPKTRGIVNEFKDTLLKYTDDAGNISIEDAQKLTQDYNKQLTAFFKNPNMNDVSKNAIIANMNRGVKDAINNSIDDVINTAVKKGSSASKEYTKLKRLYGSLTNIEDEVSKRALVEARKNIKGLDQTILDAFAGGEITDAILTLDPVKAAKSGVMKGITSWYKYLNSPDRNIKMLFETVEKGSNPSLWNQIGTKSWDNLSEIANMGIIPSSAAVTTTVAENEGETE